MEVDGGALDLDAANGGVRHRALDEQVLRLAVVLLVPATLPLELEGEGGVLILEDPAHRVHHVEEAEWRHRRGGGGAPGAGATRHHAPAPPQRRWHCATMTMAAVSARSTRGPRVSGTKPCARASATSSCVKPPSGPTSATAASPCAGSSSSRRAASSSHGNRRRPFQGAETTAASGAGESITGTRVRPDCFAAATAIRRQRSTCAVPPTTRSVVTAAMRWTPSSVAFSTTRSIFAPLSNAGASVSLSGDSRSGRALP